MIVRMPKNLLMWTGGCVMGRVKSVKKSENSEKLTVRTFGGLSVYYQGVANLHSLGKSEGAPSFLLSDDYQ